MGGICGIAYRDKHVRVSGRDLIPMLQSLDFSEPGEKFAFCEEKVAFGAQGSKGQLTGVANAVINGDAKALSFHGNVCSPGSLVPDRKGKEPDLFEELLYLYQKEGMAFLHRLRGDFALAVWDARDDTLYLATDRFRVQPIFYYYDSDKLVFASRMKGILASPVPVRSTIDVQSVADLVACSVVPTPKTIFREVKKLPAGHVLTYRHGEIHVSSYWDINFLNCNGTGEAELARNLRARLNDAVRVRLEADPDPDRIGTFLSGGVDSTTVTGLLSQLLKRPVKSFSIGFEEEKFNEINYARISARALGSDHHEYFVTAEDTASLLPVLPDVFDEPFANASAIPTYFCAKLASEDGVDVLYAGDGGDELFAGNERYATQRVFDYYSKIPAWVRDSVAKPLVFALADTFGFSPLEKAKKYIQRASIPYPQRLWSYGFFRIVPPADFFEADFLQAIGQDYNPYSQIDAYYYDAPAKKELDRQLFIDLKLAICDNDLFKVTRMSALADVAVRFPFLDHRVAEFAASIPARIKMPRTELRSFFKRAYADLLPPEVQRKKKHGFGLPIAMWLRSNKRLNEMMQDLVLGSRTIQRGYFKRKALEAVLECHKTDQTSFYGTVLWNLMVLELWHRRWVN